MIVASGSGFVAVAALAAVFALFGEADADRWVTHTIEVRRIAGLLLSEMQDAETGQRGFLLTQNLSYLEPYDRAASSAPATLETLRKLTSDNPVQKDRLNSLEALINSKLAELRQTITLTRDGQRDAALEIVNTNQGKKLMDNIGASLATFSQEELDLLGRRQAESQTLRNWLVTLFGLSLAAATGLAGFFAHSAQQLIKRLEDQAAELKAEVKRRLKVEDTLKQAHIGLETGAQALGRHEPMAFAATGVAEVDHALEAFNTASNALLAHERRLRAIVDTATDAILVIDEGGIVQSFNPAAESIFGYQASEVVGNNVGMLMPEPDRTAHDGYLDAYRRMGIAKIIGVGREVEAKRKDGTTFPVDLAVAEWRIEGKRFFTGVIRDITERKQAEEHVRFVMVELSHRTKNVLAVVQTMAWKTARTSTDLEDFEDRFASRVQALACSHDLLTKGEWHGVRLEDLVRGQLHLFGAEKHLDAHGPDLVLRPEAAQSLGLVLHELATNASKYGALTSPAGRIEVGWSIDPEDSASRRFRMCWRESGGPEASPPKRYGFGHTVIKQMTEKALKGEVALEFTPAGFEWQLTAPALSCLANQP